MSYIFSICLLLLLATTAQAQQGSTIQQIEFHARTRGSAEKITVTPDSVMVEKTGREGNHTSSKSITTEQWQELLHSLQNVNLSEMGKLEAPTQLRASDAALHATITITTSTETYTSSTFDNHHPAKPLQPLMHQLEQLTITGKNATQE